MSKSKARYDRRELARIEALYGAGKTDRAIEELRELSKSTLSSRSLRARLIDWLQRAGRKEEAISELFRLQELLVAQQDPLAAISAGLKLIELDPTFDNPLSYVAKVNTDRLLAEREKEDSSSESAGDASTEENEKPLHEIPLLSELTPEELSRVALTMKRRLLHEGAVLFDEGDASQTLCFVVSGSLDIVTQGRVLDTVTAGQCVGEFAFLTGEPRNASLVAGCDCEVLELSAGSMQAVMKDHPRVLDVLERMYRGRVLARVLAESPLFSFLGAGDRHRIAARFELVTLGASEAVFRQGDQDGALYLVKRGRLKVTNRGFGESASEVILGHFGPNEFFGEVSYLTGVERTASVVATMPSEILRIDRDELDELVAEYPQLQQILKKFHVERVMEAVNTAKTTAG